MKASYQRGFLYEVSASRSAQFIIAFETVGLVQKLTPDKDILFQERSIGYLGGCREK
jgi:hypothetical protein